MSLIPDTKNNNKITSTGQTATPAMGSGTATVAAAESVSALGSLSLLEMKKDLQPTIKPKITSVYRIGDRIGHRGGFGEVRQAIHRISLENTAVKIIKKQGEQQQQDDGMLYREFLILKCISHKNIISLVEAYEDKKRIFFVMELCRGGDLLEKLKAQPNGRFGELDAFIVFKQLLDASIALHKAGVMHLDIKPTNIMFVNNSLHSLKLIDFGLSQFVNTKESSHTMKGTLQFLAPEVLHGSYSDATDMWALGVVLFIMLFGYNPFDPLGRCRRRSLEKNILHGIDYDFFPNSVQVSEEVKDLLILLLSKDVAQRPSASEAMNHPWITINSS